MTFTINEPASDSENFKKLRKMYSDTLQGTKGIGDGALNKLRTASAAWALNQAFRTINYLITRSELIEKFSEHLPGMGEITAERLVPRLVDVLQGVLEKNKEVDWSVLFIEFQKEEDHFERFAPKRLRRWEKLPAGKPWCVTGEPSLPAAPELPTVDTNSGKIDKPPQDGQKSSFLDALKTAVSHGSGKVHFVFPDYTPHMLFVMSGRTIWYTGPAGTGKTTVAKVIAKKLGHALVRVNLHEGTSDMELIGKMGARATENGGTETVWQDGPILQAMTTGLDENGEVVGPPAILLIDEVDAANAGVLMILQRLLEADRNGRSLMVGEDGGRVVKAHPDFSIILTSNTKGHGDMTGRYQGTAQQNAALMDRVDAVFEFFYPSLHKVYKDCAPKSFLDRLQKVFDSIQAAIQKGEINIDFSLRKLNSLIFALRTGIHFWSAVECTCLSHFDTPEEVALRELFEKQFEKTYDFSQAV